MLEKYPKLWDEIKYHIQTINAGKSGKYDKDCMKIKFSSDDDLTLNKIQKTEASYVNNNCQICFLKKMVNPIRKFS